MRIKPKKRLGQNFLTDKNIQDKIISSLELKTTDTILEVGAGRGELTSLIAAKVKRVFAVEIDPDLYGQLEEKIKDCPNVTPIKEDIIKLNLKKYLPKSNAKIKAFGNIPYYISTPIIERLLEYRKKVDTIFITVQKEFAKRITAPAGSKVYGSLSCFVQYYTQPQIIFEIKRTSFFPSPKVDSCLLRLAVKKKTALARNKERLLFKVIRTAFNQRRKTLRNSLKDTLSLQTQELFFKKYSKDRNIRPEDLTLQDFINLIELK